MKKNKLEQLANSLSNAIKPNKKQDATSKILSQFEPLPKVISKPEDLGNTHHEIQQSPQINPIAIQINEKLELSPSSLQKPLIQETPLKADNYIGSTPKVQQTPRSKTGRAIKPTGLTAPREQQTSVSITSTEEGHINVPINVIDNLPKQLDPYEFMIYLKLFRLSHGYKTNQCLIGYKGLAECTGLSERYVRRAVPRLISMNLIKVLEVFNLPGKQGTLYEILLPE